MLRDVKHKVRLLNLQTTLGERRNLNVTTAIIFRSQLSDVLFMLQKENHTGVLVSCATLRVPIDFGAKTWVVFEDP